MMQGTSTRMYSSFPASTLVYLVDSYLGQPSKKNPQNAEDHEI